MKVYFAATSDQFIEPIIATLQAVGVECVVNKVFDRKASLGSDIIWCEWGDNNALAVQEFITPAKKILRVHRYEAFTDIWSQLNPEAFDSIIFVAEHIKWEAKARLGRPIENAVIVRNILDSNKYQISSDKKPNNKIAYAGYLCRKKGFGEMLMLASSLPDYEFHVAGRVQETDIANFFYEDKPDNVFYYDWQDLNEFYKDKTYVLGTALSESAHMSVLEGMLCGLVPIQRKWKGSDTIYPAENLWNSVADVKKILKAKVNFEDNRKYVIENYNPNTAIAQIMELLNIPKQERRKYETLTVGIVQTRVKYLDELLHTLSLQKRQVQDFKVHIINNFDKDMTVGKAFNQLADECDTDWILYIGDDDIVSQYYIDDMFAGYYDRQWTMRNIVAITTGCMIWDSDSHKAAPTGHFPTGCWKADFIRKHRFDETLVRQVDTEFVKRVSQNSEGVMLQLDWIYGYYYRQHNKNISGNKFTEGAIMHQEPVEESNVTGQ